MQTTVRILLLGSTGQLGRILEQMLRPLGQVHALDRSTLNLADASAIRDAVREYAPSVIVNAAAYTAVDRAESESELAMSINGTAPGVLAEEARRANAVLVHYSTDYVFDGTKPVPYLENDAPNPLNVYGRTKLSGEKAIQTVGGSYYILRTSWVYAPHGANFLNTILRLAGERPELRIVDDQVGTPTSARAIAEATMQVLQLALSGGHARHGLYHMAGAGAVTWYGFAQAIVAAAQQTLGSVAPTLVPISTPEYPLPAQRPANSRLDSSRLASTFGIRILPWQEMLGQCLQEKWEASARTPGSS